MEQAVERFKFCDPPIQLPKLYVVAINKLLGFFFGRLIVGASNIDAIPDMPVRAQNIRAVLLHGLSPHVAYRSIKCKKAGTVPDQGTDFMIGEP
jgi:hypothetical protein